MKTKGLLRIVVLFFCVIGFSGCNDDESEFSSTEIQQALFDMKGTYKGAPWKFHIIEVRKLQPFPME